MDQITSLPSRKVSYGTTGGVGGGVVLAWLWNIFAGPRYGEMPAEVAAAVGGLFVGIVAHLTRERPKSGSLR